MQNLGKTGGLGGLMQGMKSKDEELKARVQARLAAEEEEEGSAGGMANFEPAQPAIRVFTDEDGKKPDNVPSLDLQNMGGGRKSIQKAQQKSQQEKEFEAQLAKEKIDGPSEKLWLNFGIPEVDDNDQLIKLDKMLKPEAKLSIKETVERQTHDIIKKKRAWAYYEKHQPDFQAFETDIRKIIVRLVGPTVTENTKNSVKIEKIHMYQESVEKRLNDIEFVYKRTAKNASAHQDALTELETRSSALKLTEQRLQGQVAECKSIKQKLEEKFSILRDDRSEQFKRLDHIDSELDEYRAEIRSIHDQISESVFEKVREANARSLTNEAMFESVKMKAEEVMLRFEYLVEQDFREQAILVGKLQESYIEQRKAITQLDKAIVTQFDWLDKNRIYDHQINLLMAQNNQLQFDFDSMNKYLTGIHKTEVQEQIDNTIQAVFGNRKKFMKQLKSYQDGFYENLGKDGEDKLGKFVKRSSIVLNDEDSDDSVLRMKKQLQNDAEMLGSGVTGGINGAQLMQMLKQHDDQKLQKVRDKYLEKKPLRRCARYKENLSYEFVQDKLSKLRLLSNKQLLQMSQQSVYKHLAIQPDRRLSTSLSSTSPLRGRSLHSKRSGFSVNRMNQGKKKSSNRQTTPGLPNLKAISPILESNKVVPSPSNKKVIKTDFMQILYDQNEVKNTFTALKNRLKLQIAEELVEELDKTNKKFKNMKLLKVKQNTIKGALDAYKDNRDYQMTRLEIAAIGQVLTTKKIKDSNGNVMKLTDFHLYQENMIKRIVDYEFQHRGESSSERSSKASRFVDVFMQPPVIAIEAQASSRSHQRSKTMVAPSRQTTPKLDSCEPSSSPDSSLQYSHVKTGQGQLSKKLEGLTDLKSVKGSDKGDDTESLQRSSHRPIAALALQHVQDSKSSNSLLRESDSVTTHEITSSNKKAKISQLPLEKNPVQQHKSKLKKRPSTAGDARGQKEQAQAGATRDEDSFDFPEDTQTVIETGTIKTQIGAEDLGLLPDEIFVPDTDQILVKMKDQIDELEDKVQERTNELREVQKYIKRHEVSLEAELVQRFEYVFNMMSHDKADMAQHLQSRLDIIADRFINVKKNIAAQGDSAGQDLVAIKRRVKLFGRRVDSRMDEVNVEHDHVMSKYNGLLTANNYIGELAHTVIKIVELNSCLIKADERDKRSICLMGSKGPQTVHEKNQEVQMMRLQQQVDELEQQDEDQRLAGQQQPQPQQQQTQKASNSIRPASGMSHFSQKSTAQSQKQKFGHAARQDAYPVLQIDKRCQNCSDNKGQLLHLFKIACLSYFPGQVDYCGKKVPKNQLMLQQDDFVNELKMQLLKSGAINTEQHKPVVRKDYRCGNLGSSAGSVEQEDRETQMNSEHKLKHPAFSDTALSRNRNEESSQQMVDSRKSTEGKIELHVNLPDSKTSNYTASRQQLPPQSSLKNFTRPILSVNQKPVEQLDILSEKNHTKKDTIQIAKLQGLSNLDYSANEPEMSTGGNLRGLNTNTRIAKGARVSFDRGQPPMSAKSRDSGNALKRKTVLQPSKIEQTQTSFRFNCTHELLAFNQEQISQIVPNSMHDRKQAGGPPVDGKLMQIQKLKEKAMMIKMSREVNKPNSIASAKEQSQQFRMHSVLTPPATNSDILPTKDQVEYAQGIARLKHQKETQMMIETRERFTKRFQFEKLSHQILETPTETQFSGSAHNELARYDSKTIFRQTHRQQPAESRMPQTYANLMQTESTTLPKLTRNYSAAFNTGRGNFGFAGEEASTTDAAVPGNSRMSGKRKTRNQRPISSMIEMRESQQAGGAFWKTAKRVDGRSVVIMNRQRMRDLDFSQNRESNGTEQLTQQLRGVNTALSLDNILLSKEDE